MPRGGNHGGGTTIRRIELSERAAIELRRRATIAGTRYQKDEANQAASQILEAIADGRALLVPLSEEIKQAVPWLQEARSLCFSEAAQRGLDQLIAAIVITQSR